MLKAFTTVSCVCEEGLEIEAPVLKNGHHGTGSWYMCGGPGPGSERRLSVRVDDMFVAGGGAVFSTKRVARRLRFHAWPHRCVMTKS